VGSPITNRILLKSKTRRDGDAVRREWLFEDLGVVAGGGECHLVDQYVDAKVRVLDKRRHSRYQACVEGIDHIDDAAEVAAKVYHQRVHRVRVERTEQVARHRRERVRRVVLALVVLEVEQPAGGRVGKPVILACVLHVLGDRPLARIGGGNQRVVRDAHISGVNWFSASV
jgi:hypothetical protein